MAGKLSDVQLQRWVKAGKPMAGKSDGDGLTFTLSKGGTATWVLRYRLAGKQREKTLGNYPDMTLKSARKAAVRDRAKVDDGRDVAAEKRKALSEKARAGSFKALCEDYLARGARTLSESTRAETQRFLEKDAYPRIGHIPAREVTPADIVDTVEAVAKRSDSVARRLYEILSVVFAHGVAKHAVPVSPLAALKPSAILGERPEARPRMKLAEDELRAFLAAIPGLGRTNELALRILLATCSRKGELIGAQWKDVDLERGLWTVPDENSKTGRGFVIPLPPAVAAWFGELRGLARTSRWVLPSPLHGDRPINESTLNAALKRIEAKTRVPSPHDLRSTARSYLAHLGVDVIVAERCLNHSLGGLVAVYDKHDYMDERRRALDLWASYLANVETAREWSVTPIKRAAGK
jgi:integrase